MKYLLSNNKVTTDLHMYIKDLIKLHMGIRVQEVPYWSGGTNDIIEDITSEGILNSMRSVVSTVITKISNEFDGIDISISDIIVNNSNVRVELKINNIIEIYDIQRRY